MKYCSVKGCYSSDQDESKQHFFRFPADLKRALLWHEFCQDPSRRPCVNRYICNKHFLYSDYVRSDFYILKKNAVPSVNGPNSINAKETDVEHIEEKPTVTATSKRDSLNSDSRCSILEHFSLTSPIEYSYSKHSKISKHIDLAKTSSDIQSTEFLEQSSDVLKRVGTVIKAYHTIDSVQKNSLIKSVTPTVVRKRKEISIPDTKPFKVYKSVQNNLEVNMKPQLVFQDEEDEKCKVNAPEIRNDFLKVSQKQNTLKKDCKFHNLDITLNSSLVFESANSIFTPNVIYKEKTKSDLLVSKLPSTNSQSEKIRTYENLSLKTSHFHTVNEETTQINSKEDLLSLHECSRSLQKRLNQMNSVQRKEINRYRNKVFKNKLLPSHLDVNDPKYSIAAIAESLGTFNSYVEKPVKKVDLKAGEWFKLYEPSEVKFPKVPESQIGPMVNYLRSKLPALNDRDKLEVSFLLSLMSVYPNAPKHVQELLSQRLKLVYIGTKFSWNTALALGFNSSKQTTTLNTSPPKKRIYKHKLRNKTFQNPTMLASSNSNVNSSNNCSTKNNHLQVTSKDNLIKQVKRPQFAFEIIVQEKSTKSERNEDCRTIKEL